MRQSEIAPTKPRADDHDELRKPYVNAARKGTVDDPWHETALSFLGLGLTDPVISRGVLLQAVQQISIVALYPWLLLTGAAIVIVVLAFNFVGDGLRDAADPYTR